MIEASITSTSKLDHPSAERGCEMISHKIVKSSEPDESALVFCEVCRQELPARKALRREAEDYALWFCGQGCYSKWRSEQDSGDDD